MSGMRGFVSVRSAMTSSVLVTMRTLHETLHPHSRPHYYRSCRCRLLHAGRQHAQSCVDENEPWSAIGLHVGMVAARPSQEELQFCLAAAQHALRRRSFGPRCFANLVFGSGPLQWWPRLKGSGRLSPPHRCARHWRRAALLSGALPPRHATSARAHLHHPAVPVARAQPASAHSATSTLTRCGEGALVGGWHAGASPSIPFTRSVMKGGSSSASVAHTYTPLGRSRRL